MKLEILSFDKYSNEADLKLSNDLFELIVYCPNFSKITKEKIKLVAFMVENIQITNNPIGVVKNSKGYYSYSIIGKLIEKNNHFSKVLISDMEIIIYDYIPNDIELGSNISFDVQRIDLD